MSHCCWSLYYSEDIEKVGANFARSFTLTFKLETANYLIWVPYSIMRLCECENYKLLQVLSVSRDS